MTNDGAHQTLFDDEDGLNRFSSELELKGFDTEQELVDADYNGGVPCYEENK